MDPKSKSTTRTNQPTNQLIFRSAFEKAAIKTQMDAIISDVDDEIAKNTIWIENVNWKLGCC